MGGCIRGVSCGRGESALGDLVRSNGSGSELRAMLSWESDLQPWSESASSERLTREFDAWSTGRRVSAPTARYCSAASSGRSPFGMSDGDGGDRLSGVCGITTSARAEASSVVGGSAASGGAESAGSAGPGSVLSGVGGAASDTTAAVAAVAAACAAAGISRDASSWLAPAVTVAATGAGGAARVSVVVRSAHLLARRAWTRVAELWTPRIRELCVFRLATALGAIAVCGLGIRRQRTSLRQNGYGHNAVLNMIRLRGGVR